MTTITVMVGEDNEMIRDAVRLMVDSTPDMKLVAEAGDLRSTKRILASLRPRVLLLDLSLPDGSGLAEIGELRELAPETAIVIVTMHEVAEMAERAFSLGVSAYVAKSATGTELLAAIREVVAGRRYLSLVLRGKLDSGGAGSS